MPVLWNGAIWGPQRLLRLGNVFSHVMEDLSLLRLVPAVPACHDDVLKAHAARQSEVGEEANFERAWRAVELFRGVIDGSAKEFSGQMEHCEVVREK